MTTALPTEIGAPSDHAAPPSASQSAPTEKIEGRTPLQLAWARLRKDRVSIGCAVVIVLLVIVALAAPLLAKLIGHQPNTQYRSIGINANALPVGPGKHFVLGADSQGRDILVRIIYGTRVSLLVGVVATGISVLIGILVGLVAGFYRGRVDTFLSRFMDVVLSFPFLLFAIALVSVFGPSLKIAIFVIAFFSWPGIGRIVRGLVLSVREKEYIEAARSLGAGDLRIMFLDVLPNLVGPLIVYSTLLIPTAIVFEATLSYLGLGVVPPTPTWGNMLAEAQDYYTVAWWYVVFPGLALLITTLAFNLLGDGLRDALDPRAERVFAK